MTQKKIELLRYLWKRKKFSQQLACRRHKKTVSNEKAVEIVYGEIVTIHINRIKGFEPVLDVYWFKI